MNKTSDPGEVKMTFAEHLEELRRRLVRAGLVISVVFCLGWFIFPGPLESLFMLPHRWAVERLAAREPPVLFEPRLAVLSPLEQIFYRVKVALLVSGVAGLPYLLFELWGFVGAGLFRNERRAVMRYLPWSLLLALVGIVFGFLVLIPFVLEYLYGMPDPKQFVQAYRLESYFSLFLLFTLALAAMFQLPLIMLGLHAAGIGSAAFYSKYRRHFIVGDFVVSAVITPPEPVSMILMAIPMMLLYEVGVAGIRIAERRKRRAPAGARG